MIDFYQLKSSYPTQFLDYAAMDCKYMKDIIKDVDRTLTEHAKYSTEEKYKFLR